MSMAKKPLTTDSPKTAPVKASRADITPRKKVAIKTSSKPSKSTIRTVRQSEMMQKTARLKRAPENSVVSKIRTILSSGVVLLILLIGVLFRDIAYGEIFLVLYAVIAIVCRVSSVTSFRMAFVMLLALPVVGVLNNHPLAQNFAVYGFLLLVIGIISAFIEQFSMNRTESKKLESVVKKV